MIGRKEIVKKEKKNMLRYSNVHDIVRKNKKK
jgi:hypothetical protein